MPLTNPRRVFWRVAKVQKGSIYGCCLCGQHPQITSSVFFAIHQKFIDAALGSGVERDFCSGKYDFSVENIL